MMAYGNMAQDWYPVVVKGDIQILDKKGIIQN
jgi:hypothetical protein